MNDWILIAFTMIASAFAAGMEIAFTSANKLRIELDNKQGKFTAKILSGFVKSPSRFIATMLIANNIALVIYGIVMSEDVFTESLLENYLPAGMHSKFVILLIQSFLSTIIILIAAEFIPKTIFRINPNSALELLAVPAKILLWLLTPVVVVAMSIAKFIMNKIFRIDFIEEKPVFGKIDLDLYVRDLTSKNSQSEEIEEEIRIFQNALDFNEVRVRESMIPRKEIVAIHVEEPIEELKKLFIDTQLSRIVVFRDSIDNVIGFVHSSELFKQPKDILSALTPVITVPEITPANELLKQFIEQRKSIAIVVDEFGGTSGLVTMEDLIEEIFGEIHDEHDEQDLTEKKISDQEFIFSGRLEIDYLNKKYGLMMPEHEAYETLGGFIMHHHENVPMHNEEIIIPPFAFKILQLKDNRIQQVSVKVGESE